MSDTVTRASARTGGKHLVFRLNGEDYGLPVLSVREIHQMMAVTPVPRTPSFIKGVANLRGKVLPVTDLRERLGMPHSEDAGLQAIIVVSVAGIEMGLIVDKVSEVADIASEDIEETPSFGPKIDTNFIAGIGKRGGNILLLLNLEKLFTNDELNNLKNERS